MAGNTSSLHEITPRRRENRGQIGILFFLEQEMEKFFFGEGSAKPAGYVPPQEENI
jgi:Fe-S cluster biosynthesis and repair protein YggX